MARRTVLTGIVFLSCFAGAFVFYTQFMGSNPAFGFFIGDVVFGWLVVVLMSIPIFALTAIPLLAVEYWMGYVIPRRRYRASACVVCGYSGAGDLGVCPECGKRPAVVPSSDAVLVRAATLVSIAWISATALGAVLGETWLLADEAAFQREVATLQATTGVPTAHYRGRWWPGKGNGMFYTPGSGFRCDD